MESKALSLVMMDYQHDMHAFQTLLVFYAYIIHILRQERKPETEHFLIKILQLIVLIHSSNFS